MDVKIDAVQLSWEEGCNIIVGQSHFIKTVEDIPEILVSSVPGIEYGLAFCEASGPCLIRTEGNDTKLIDGACACAKAVGAGHTFFIVIRNAFPINLLNQIKACQEVATVFAATANPLQIVTAETGQGRGILGVVDGSSPSGVEGDREKAERKELLRKFGYKFA
jgi:adenosine/AMP kinase